MKKLLIVLLLSCLMAFQCEDDYPAPDNLDATGLFGSWEIQEEIINGNILDMIPRCCEFLRFDKDGDVTDNIGHLTYTDSQGLVNDGTFEVDTVAVTITFIYDDNDTTIFDFSVDSTSGILTINFTEGNVNYTQDWVKIN